MFYDSSLFRGGTSMNKETNRREFLKGMALLTGGAVLVPFVSSCGTSSASTTEQAETLSSDVTEKAATAAPEAAKSVTEIPMTEPSGWDAVAYNKARGNAGAIPESYLASINGPDGDTKHLGKHLPYQPALDAAVVPAGFIALMWGDESKGYAKHPNAPKSESNPTGHWYNWIKVRKATDGEAEEVQSSYSDWPGTAPSDSGAYAVFGGGEITAEKGKNTVYLVALPKDVKKGDRVRIWAHCLTHGEYVDFITV